MMRPHTKMICLFAAVALAVGGVMVQGQRLEAQNAAKAKPTAVAVVNVAELIAKCQKNVDFQAGVQKRRVQLEQEQKKKQEAINNLKNELDLAGNAAERQKVEREITKALYEFQAWSQIEQQNLLREQRLFLIELYGEVDKAVAAVAEKNGIDMVLFDTPSPDFENLNPEQLVQVIGNRRVVYRNENVNITAVVLEKLNLDHQNR